MDAVIFDFDGVLMDSEALHARVIQQTLEPLGLAVELDHIVGVADPDVFARAFASAGQALSEELLGQLLEQKRRRTVHEFRSGAAVPFPGAIELLRAAAARGPVAVCSAATRAEIEAALDALGVLGHIGTIVSVDQVARTKPDPEPYRLAAQRLGVRPSRCVAIEDSPTGLASALGAGMTVAAVLHTTPLERLRGAHTHIASIAQLTLEHLESLVRARRGAEPD